MEAVAVIPAAAAWMAEVAGKRVIVPMADCFAAALAVCCQSTVLQPSMDGCIAGGVAWLIASLHWGRRAA